MALERGMIQQEALNECLTLVSENGRSLLELFRERKMLTAQQIDQLQSEASKRIRDRQQDQALAAAARAPSTDDEPTQVATPSRGEATAAGGLPAEAARAAREPGNLFGKF